VMYDHYVRWFSYDLPSEGFTICSRQSSNKDFQRLYSDEEYDIMIEGKLDSKGCIDKMEEAAKASRDAIRIISFLIFWCGFCMMFSLVSFFADRLGSLIPCGLGEMFSDCVDFLICVITCPPACACWGFWFTLAWLWVRPIPYGIIFALNIVLMGAMYWWFQKKWR